jgi:uncharacterized protein YcnI
VLWARRSWRNLNVRTWGDADVTEWRVRDLLLNLLPTRFTAGQWRDHLVSGRPLSGAERDSASGAVRAPQSWSNWSPCTCAIPEMTLRLLTFVAALSTMAIAFGASAHVTVWPKQSVQGAREKYVIRMPNEKSSPTIRLDAEFPVEMRVTSFEQTSGWTIAIRRNGEGAITGASWTGELPAEQFVEFGIIGVNPKAGGPLTWRFIQSYADGTRVEWTGEPGSKTPAPQVMLRPATEAASHN